jgi:hypothetical protein
MQNLNYFEDSFNIQIVHRQLYKLCSIIRAYGFSYGKCSCGVSQCNLLYIILFSLHTQRTILELPTTVQHCMTFGQFSAQGDEGHNKVAGNYWWPHCTMYTLGTRFSRPIHLKHSAACHLAFPFNHSGAHQVIFPTKRPKMNSLFFFFIFNKWT